MILKSFVRITGVLVFFIIIKTKPTCLPDIRGFRHHRQSVLGWDIYILKFGRRVQFPVGEIFIFFASELQDQDTGGVQQAQVP